MNVKTPEELKKTLSKIYEEITSRESEKIKSGKNYEYGDILQIQISDPLVTCTHYNYAYFKKKFPNCVSHDFIGCGKESSDKLQPNCGDAGSCGIKVYCGDCLKKLFPDCVVGETENKE